MDIVTNIIAAAALSVRFSCLQAEGAAWDAGKQRTAEAMQGEREAEEVLWVVYEMDDGIYECMFPDRSDFVF